jgi:hypothetical protein
MKFTNASLLHDPASLKVYGQEFMTAWVSRPIFELVLFLF